MTSHRKPFKGDGGRSSRARWLHALRLPTNVSSSRRRIHSCVQYVGERLHRYKRSYGFCCKRYFRTSWQCLCVAKCREGFIADSSSKHPMLSSQNEFPSPSSRTSPLPSCLFFHRRWMCATLVSYTLLDLRPCIIDPSSSHYWCTLYLKDDKRDAWMFLFVFSPFLLSPWNGYETWMDDEWMWTQSIPRSRMYMCPCVGVYASHEECLRLLRNRCIGASVCVYSGVSVSGWVCLFV